MEIACKLAVRTKLSHNSIFCILVKNLCDASKTLVRRKHTTVSRKAPMEAKDESWQPKNWQQHLANIRAMRQAETAPVDTMGCSELHDRQADPKLQRFQILVSLMLSSQTKDTTTAAAMERLKANGLTPKFIIDVPDAKLEQLLNPVSFYKRKVIYLKKTSQIVLDQYDGDIPSTVADLMKLPGVGSKMSHLAVQCAWDRIEGIGVDTHVHRIANWLQWLPKPTTAPEQTRVALENWLPRELWSEINHLLVGFGQTICKPVRPRCDVCLNKDICPYFRKTHRGIWKKQSFIEVEQQKTDDADEIATVSESVVVEEKKYEPPLTEQLSKQSKPTKRSKGAKASSKRSAADDADIEETVSPYFNASVNVVNTTEKEAKATGHRSSRRQKRTATTVTTCIVEKVNNDPVLDSVAIKGDDVVDSAAKVVKRVRKPKS